MKMEYKQAYPCHNGMQSGRGGETDMQAEKEDSENEARRQTFRDTHYEMRWLDQPFHLSGWVQQQYRAPSELIFTTRLP